MRWFYPERFTTDPEGAAAVRACADATLRRHVEWIDAELATAHGWSATSDTAADIYLFMLTRWGRWQEPPALEPPNLGGHFDRLLERPAVRRMMIEEELT